MPDSGKETVWTTCGAAGCNKTIHAGPPHYAERWLEVTLWICRDCYESRITRETRNTHNSNDNRLE